VDPVGTDEKPFFGWYVNDRDDNEVQTAYQILVASSKKLLDKNIGDLWNSGKTKSSRQNHVEFGGKALLAATRYFWKARTWDKDEQVGPFSKPNTFDVGLLKASDWNGAKWIKRTSVEKDQFTYFRKSFFLTSKKVIRATAYISVWHNYELYLNGTLIGKGQAYHYPQYSYYNAYDVTSTLKKKGENLVACLAHWYGGGQGRVAGVPGFLMKTVVEYSDGSRQIIGTDASWKQIRVDAWLDGQPTRNGEGVGYVDRIDAGKIIPNWCSPDLNDSLWHPAVEIGAPPVAPWIGELQPDLTRLIEKEITPVSVKDLGNGTYVINLGKVYAGVPKITFSGGQAGDVINMRGSFTLENDGTASLRQTQSTNMSYYFILNGNTAVFQPFVYFGMRYFQVDNAPCPLTAENVKFVTRHYELDPSRSDFESSDSMLNQVWDLMKHTLLLGEQEQYLDTPTREKGAFLGDGFAQGVSDMTTMGDRAFNLRVLLEFLDSQDQYWPDGRMNAVYPNVDRKRDIPDFTQFYPIWAWDYYQQSGDVQFIRENYQKIRKIAEYDYTYRNDSTGLIKDLAGGAGGYTHGIIDWPPSMRYGYDIETASRTVINSYAYGDFDVLSKMAEVVGNDADQVLYRDRAEKLRQAINRYFINADHTYIDGLYADQTASKHVSQHANMLPLALGIVPAECMDSVVKAVKDRKMSVGMVTVRWLPEALGQADEGKHLLELYTNPNWDGWAQTLAKGGTATWEAWDSDVRAESMSHPWGTSGLLGIQQYILGIKLLEPQAELIQIKPLDFGTALNRVKGRLPSDRGDISVEWTRTESQFTLNVILPDNMKANVWVPKGSSVTSEVMVDGKPVTGKILDNYLLVETAGSGTHRFERAL
jgi:alpha-L-rhamnosidase